MEEFKDKLGKDRDCKIFCVNGIRIKEHFQFFQQI